MVKSGPFVPPSLLPLLEITIRVDETECLSMASSHDQETERFLCTGTTGRRVSFNEAALLDHGKKTQEKGRRSDTRPEPLTSRISASSLALHFIRSRPPPGTL